MRKILILVFILLVAMIQLGIFSNIQILSGKVDLLMLGMIAWIVQRKTSLFDIILYAVVTIVFINFISAETLIIILILYVMIAITVYWSKNHIQQLPIVSMLIFSAIFTFIHLGMFALYMQLSGIRINFQDVFQSFILPSMIFNLVASIPMYLLVNELHHWVYPLEEEA